MPLPGSSPTGRSRALWRVRSSNGCEPVLSTPPGRWTPGRRPRCWSAGGPRPPEAPTAQPRSTGSCFGAVGTAVGLVDTSGEWFSCRVCGRVVDHLVLDRGELAEGALASAAVVGPFDPGHDRQAQLVAGVPPAPVQDVLLQQGEEVSTPSE